MLPEPVEADRRAFLQKGARDLRTAQRMAEEPGEFSDVVCFHAQQCAEKAFKALIVSGEMVVIDPRRKENHARHDPSPTGKTRW